MPGLAEHDFGARSSPTRRVCSEICRAHVGLGLNDASYTDSVTVGMHKMHADELASYGKRAWGVEVTRKFAGSTHEPAW